MQTQIQGDVILHYNLETSLYSFYGKFICLKSSSIICLPLVR
jgi:hypothetical protein